MLQRGTTPLCFRCICLPRVHFVPVKPPCPSSSLQRGHVSAALRLAWLRAWVDICVLRLNLLLHKWHNHSAELLLPCAHHTCVSRDLTILKSFPGYGHSVHSRGLLLGRRMGRAGSSSSVSSFLLWHFLFGLGVKHSGSVIGCLVEGCWETFSSPGGGERPRRAARRTEGF